MDYLIKSAIIRDPSSKFNNKKKDLFIKNGIIEKIGSDLTLKAKTIDAQDMSISPGWFDLKVNFCDPGFEFKEDLESGINAAIAGGFTGACHSPFVDPVVSTKGNVEYLRKRGVEKNFDLVPIGTLTENGEGKAISEMFDMYSAGALGFSDYHKDVSSGNMLKALHYTKPFDAVIISQPTDSSLATERMVHEGFFSTQLGLKGIPVIAEEIRIKRDLDLAKYSGSKVHFSGVTSEAGIDLIKKAKKEGIKVTCDVIVHHLYFNDESILEFDSNKKVYPPIRSESDRKALMRGLADGTIDAICSDHQPENIENKELEFEYASFGISGIETTFPVLMSLNLDLDVIVNALSHNPRRIMGLSPISIEEGSEANLTLFQENKEHLADRRTLRSKSKNNPYLGIELKGKVLGIINRGKYLPA